ncbi:MAG: hypothetical protein KIT87_08085 [Anaerolineae bacterium]|nr:hypothetical protein [Anaerolineae bacterium]
MSRSVTITLPDVVYEAVKQSAEATGRTPGEWIATKLADLVPGDRISENGKTPTHPVIQAILEQMAPEMGLTYEELEAQWHRRYGPQAQPRLTEAERSADEARLFQYIGAVSVGHPLGGDNDGIDADLATEYTGRHEDEP